MSLTLQNTLSNLTHHIKFPKINLTTTTTTHFNLTTTLKFPKFNKNPFQTLQNCQHPSQQILQIRHLPIKAYDPFITFDDEDYEKMATNFVTLDAFLSIMESFCVISSVVISVGCVVNWAFFKYNNVVVVVGSKVLVWLLAVSVAVGSVIRRRQWRRVCGPRIARAKPGFESGNVMERVEKLEESMRSANHVIRMLSRQLEKLGIRFWVTRKALKGPMSETAALTQKNSEATRALAVQEDILEKELVEVQKVLLAMQDQQKKQLELILAIAQSGKLLETKRAPSQRVSKNETDSNNGLKQADGQLIQTIAEQKDATIDNVGAS